MTRLPVLLMAIVALLLGAGLLLYGTQVAAQGAQAAASRVTQPVIEKARGGQCVEDPALMRRTHMELLRHQRDDTVRGGIRGAKASLKGCVECHAGASTHSVAKAPNDFCVACHEYAAVRLDCFECHTGTASGSGK